MTEYVLLDWDNTLRKGFTIKAWMEYLYENRFVSNEHYFGFLSQFEAYDNHMLDYHQLSTNSTAIYAKSIAGKNVMDIKNAGRDFCIHDGGVFPFVKSLFHSFQTNKIEIIVISGTPEMLLENYASLLGIDEVYGLTVRARGNFYTDFVERDYGACKSEIVKKICEEKGGNPIFAMGDSIADEPLISTAQYGCYIDKDTGFISLNEKVIGSVSTACEVVKKLGICS